MQFLAPIIHLTILDYCFNLTDQIAQLTVQKTLTVHIYDCFVYDESRVYGNIYIFNCNKCCIYILLNIVIDFNC